MFKDSKSLETSCYVLGAGAFGLFFRWMQLMLAYNEDGLPDASVWNVLVPLIILISAFVFRSFVKKNEAAGLVLSKNFFNAFRNEGKVYAVVRWAAGIITAVGAVLLFLGCDLDRDVKFLKVLAIFGVLAGITFPLLLTCANKPHATKNSTLNLLSFFPILFFAIWILTSYKQNSINPTLWDYAVEVLTLIVCITAFYYLAGFAYGVVNTKKCMFFCMLGAMLCVMSLADTRYIGQQIMLGGCAFMLLACNWIMIANLRDTKEDPIFSEPEEATNPEDEIVEKLN